MLTLDAHIARCEDWMAHPSHGPVDSNGVNLIEHGGYCVGVAHETWGIGSMGGSALIAYRKVPHHEIHVTSPEDVPMGAFCYYLHGDFGQPFYKFGHATTAWSNLGTCTTDYVKEGTLAIAPMALSRWTGVSTVSWTTWTQYGRIPVGRTHRQIVAASKTLNRHQLHVIHLVNIGKASDHQKHVVHVWRTTGVWAE